MVISLGQLTAIIFAFFKLFYGQSRFMNVFLFYLKNKKNLSMNFRIITFINKSELSKRSTQNIIPTELIYINKTAM